MHLLNSLHQNGSDPAYRADGVLVNDSPRLILPRAISRAFLTVQVLGDQPIFMEHGCARATAQITNGAVTGLTILNGGFGFLLPPAVQFKGGGKVGQDMAPLTASGWDGQGQIDNWTTPAGFNTLVSPAVNYRPAKATAVLTSGVVTSFLITDPGAGYVYPPTVMLTNDPLDPFGCADPSVGGGSGALLFASGGVFSYDATFCATDAIAFFSAGATGDDPIGYYVEFAP